MQKHLVKTSNYERFRSAITAVERRGAPEASWVVVAGHPGLSKSIIVNRWAVDTKAVYLRAKVDWTPAQFLDELATVLGVDTTGRRREVFGRVVAAIAKQNVPLIVDELQHLLKNRARTLEAVRDVSDITETIVVLVAGEDKVLNRLALYPQLSSRVARVVEFGTATLEDVERACRELSDVEIARDLVEEIRAQSDGLMRHVINAIAAIEQDAKRNGKKKAVAADYAGKALVMDWQKRRQRATSAPYAGNGSSAGR